MKYHSTPEVGWLGFNGILSTQVAAISFSTPEGE